MAGTHLAQRRAQARFLWFDEQTVPETGFGTLDEALWKPLLSAQGAADPALALEKMGLLARGVTGAVEATVAGLLLCSQAPDEWLPNAAITATHYRGVDRASGQLDAQTITGPLSRQIAEAVAFAVRNMRVGAYKSPARIDLPQYSERALFEAMVNAVAHRDYSIRGSRIRLSSRGAAVPNVDLLVLMPNESWRRATTCDAGEAVVELHLSHLPVTVFAAAAGYAAHLIRDWQPRRGALTIELEPLPDGGAVIFPDATGEIPGLAGRLNPVRDPLDRTFLHASGIAIDQGRPQPVHFLLGETLRLTDADGRERLARIVDIVGRAALIEYRPVG